MNKNKIITVFGFFWLILSISEIPVYLYPLPFQRHEGFKALAEEAAPAQEFLEEKPGLRKKTPQEIEQILIKETWKIWFKSLLTILAGIFAGSMLIRKKNLGRVVALSISCYVLILKIISVFTYGQARYSLKFYSMFFSYFPVQTILGMITFWLALSTVVFFSMPSTIRTIKEKMQQNTC